MVHTRLLADRTSGERSTAPGHSGTGTPTRHLAAILAADVAGYSRLMGVDEEGTLGRLKARLFAFLFRWSFFVTAWYQARQLAPILGEAGPPVRRKIMHKLRADLPFLFGGRDRAPIPLDWWWSRETPHVAAAT